MVYRPRPLSSFTPIVLNLIDTVVMNLLVFTIKKTIQDSELLKYDFSFQCGKLRLLEGDAIWSNDYMLLN